MARLKECSIAKRRDRPASVFAQYRTEQLDAGATDALPDWEPEEVSVVEVSVVEVSVVEVSVVEVSVVEVSVVRLIAEKPR